MRVLTALSRIKEFRTMLSMIYARQINLGLSMMMHVVQVVKFYIAELWHPEAMEILKTLWSFTNVPAPQYSINLGKYKLLLNGFETSDDNIIGTSENQCVGV
ncbi:PREDICTED: uncharacterized protein LOC108968167 isoform X2 [Bactrocera latifrons]|uniref:uncharacterized protein LOC108968167 isoform X2 n=1 Tax=Bactrocera latifrons TaxID=174628 RepID=UPI0008DD0C9E|nr:PREDICTED: uncharacterized protein LOC108968167 isoform X2 [Bactrocera latifrons]